MLVFALDDPRRRRGRRSSARSRAELPGVVAPRRRRARALLCAVVDAARRATRSTLARRARDGARRRARPRLRAAASRAGRRVGTLRRAFHEARCALEATALANGDAPEVASYRDLGAFTLLLSLQDDDALRLYCDSVLGPIEDGEGEYGGELLRSLEAFIEQQRPVGAGRARALLPPPHAALPDPASRGADRPRPVERPRPDRVLAGAARTGAGAMTE